MGMYVAGLGLPLALGEPVMAEAQTGAMPFAAQAADPEPAVPSLDTAPNPVLLGPNANPEEVTILQRQLTDLGFYTGPMDGDYSPMLQDSVKAFQSSVNLPATGLLDRQTWDRMSTPQLLSDASTPQGPTEIPNLLPSSLEEPPPPADAASTDAVPADSPSATPPPTPAPSTSDETASPPESPSAPPTESPDIEAVARSPWRWSWLLALPVGGGAVGGILWGWRRLRRAALKAEHYPDPLPEEVVDQQGEIKNPRDPDPLPLAPSLASADLVEVEGTDSQGEPPEPGGSAQTAKVVQRADMPRLPTVNIAETLVNELRSVDASVRQRAIWELGQRGNATAIQPLVNSLMEADSQEKSLIFAALTEIGRRSLQPMQRALALGLQDPSPEVRKNAIRDLSRLCDTLGQMSPLLIHATQDPDPEVQAIAQWALGQLNRPAPAPYLESSVEPSSLEDRFPPATP